MQTDFSKHDLSQYLESINLTLEQDYKQIQGRVKEDTGTAGDQVEETWAEVLRKWLPSHYHIVTKGRIIGIGGEASPQIDVIVLWPNYPTFLLSKKLYMASGVAAAFECKLTLRTKHLVKVFNTAISLSNLTKREHKKRKEVLLAKNENYAYEEFHRIFEYGLLAHSFEGDDPEEAAKKFTIEIEKLDRELVKHPVQMVDLICIQNLGSWVSEREAIIARPNIQGGKYTMQYLPFPRTNYNCLTKTSWESNSSLLANFSPLGSFLSRLYTKLARVDSSLMPLSQFFTSTLSTGQSTTQGARIWDELQIAEDLWEHSAIQRAKHSLVLNGFTFLVLRELV
jgi:hypothetical protein